MKYRNTKTGFVFESKADCKGENIEVIPDISPVLVEESKKNELEKKAPARKRTAK